MRREELRCLKENGEGEVSSSFEIPNDLCLNELQSFSFLSIL